MHTRDRLQQWVFRLGLAALFVLATGLTARAVDIGLPLPQTVDAVQGPAAEHADQNEFTSLVTGGQTMAAFQAAFDDGDELFETPFNAVDGGGANVGQGQRYTRTPRADLNGIGEWANHFPPRSTGPNAQSCVECHIVPDQDGAGGPSANVTRDPGHTANLGMFINRNTPALFGLGAIQRLAEEMNKELQDLRDAAVSQAQSSGKNVTQAMTAKGIGFGSIIAHPDGSVDTTRLQGVDPDLVVRPFQWKGSFATIRDFVRDAANNELGMQAVELVGDGLDGDFDGVPDELTVGDITAMTVYNAAQPRPVTKLELSRLNLIPPLSSAEASAIQAGEAVFDKTGCGTCHVKQLVINDPTFSEPSRNPNYRDARFPGGQDPVSRGVNVKLPILFDLTNDQPDNRINVSGKVIHLGSLEKDRSGHGVVRLFGDLKRHDMGPGLAESIDEIGTGASVFLTRNLWGVGSTAPYMHDGRATTLTEAIIDHGGEGETAKQAFLGLSTANQQDLIAFLNNQVLFKQPAAATTVTNTSSTSFHKRR
ncbi:MAG TPA: di-heme oxidoredictase family protein [Nitrospiria bacterium]|nr:di-heme oxidoredictase family protein [Nitrospiria bacterium]